MKVLDLARWKKGLFWLVTSPMMVGFVITFSTVKLTFDYYSTRGSKGRVQGISGLIQTAHQKSIDYRLRARGPRPVDKNLALLTVDEKALNTIGRWPWSREILAQAVDRAFAGGARILAFDMVFPEPQENPVDKVIEQMRTGGRSDTATEALLGTYKERLDADKVLGAAMTEHADKIIAGSFASAQQEWPAETEFCQDLIFKNSTEAKQWDKEEVLLAVNDSYLPYVPVGVNEFFTLVLKEKEAYVREQFGPVRTKAAEVELEGRLYEQLHKLCFTALNDFREPLNQIWKDEVLAKENPKEFKYETYDAWLESFRQRAFPNMVVNQEVWKLNTPVIGAGTKHTAHFNTELDSDGTIRNKSLVARTGNSYFPALALKAYLVANNFNASPHFLVSAATGDKEVEGLEITNNETGDPVATVPVDRQGRLLLNYAGPARMYPYLSFADLLGDSATVEIEQLVFNPANKNWEMQKRAVNKAAFIKDKIFVVGATATGIYDLRVTPFEENYPGAETHLNALDNLLNHNFFRNIPDERALMPLVLAVLGLLLSVVLSYLGAVSGLLITASAMLGTWLIDQHYFFGQGVIVTIIWPMVMIMALYVSLTFYRYLTEERGKKELRQTFQKYVSPAIVEEILSDPKNIELGGKKVHLTVMFSDVRGFTTISEKLDPRALSDLLNSYLTPMTEIVFSNRGTLDKYMGDAIMAFFGAPITYGDHAKHACRCALQSLVKLFELQKEFERKGLPIIDLGIGLNTGDVSVGNMGSETVRSYTVMGDAVNLASRLEGINKEYGTRIILSEMTYLEVKDSFLCREVDWVRVKGKILPVKIYELISEGPAPNAQTAEMLKWFNEGYLHYHAKAWQSGLDCFSKALDINPTDQVSKLYIERCQGYLTTPPEPGWDGVFVMKSK